MSAFELVPGAAGATGATGATGAVGSTGATGTVGATGATGVAGAVGATGATGTAGAVGATGATGTAGAAGATGATGTAGAAGATGATGVQGSTGATGVQGSTGATGAQGATGIVGLDGLPGATGATGTAGAQGSTGATGTAGTEGATGATGTAGAQGSTGATGVAGANGATGATGVAGANGATGATGTGGAQGATGATGTAGAAGATGATGAYGGPVTLPYNFSTTTTDADPGSGNLRVNNADVTAATAAYIDLAGSDAVTYTTLIDSFDDLAQASVKGWLALVSRADPTKFVLYRVTAWTTATGYRKLTLVHVASSGATPFANADPILVKWTWAGTDGTTGATGTAGAAGATGATGAGGAAGATGATGAQGATGAKPAGQLFLSAAGMWPSVTNGAAGNVKAETATNKQNVYLLDFADGATKLFAEGNVVMPSDWDGGTVTATFYWLTNGTGTGGVVWGCAGRSYGDAETLDQAWGTEVTVTDNGVATANQVLKSSATGAVTLSGTPAAGELALFRVSRDPTNGSDTLAQTARLLGVMIAYTRA